MVMRLIDADKMNLLLGISDRDIYAKMMLDHMDTVDTVPVTLCKDCKHSWEDIDGRCCSYGPLVDCTVPDDFFCALAERKDGDSNVHSDQRPEKRN